MKRVLRLILVLLLLLVPAGLLSAEKVAALPKPTGYVSDFAHVLSPTTDQQLEDLCTQVDHQAHAQIAVVTVNSLDDDQTIEEFAVELEEKWKVGNKEDRGLLMVLSMHPRRIRIEVGYGLEGVLNDAKVGAILDRMTPDLRANDYNEAIPLGVQALTQVIATDANVTIQSQLPPPVVHTYHREPAPPPRLGLGQVIVGIGVVLLIIFLIATGNIGWLFLLLNMLSGGGGGGGGDDDRRGGGFGGFGGGSSGGGGASRDF